jgi:serine/threonine-protein kinase
MKNSDVTVKSASTTGPVVYEFAGLRLDLARRVLERDGACVALYPRAFDALSLLVQNRDSLLTKELLLQRLWPGTIVEENSLARVISDLRKALGDAAKCIVTAARRGYRFEAEVRAADRQREREHERGRTVVAVLPFTAIGRNTDRLLSIGLADALINRLSRIDEIVVRPTWTDLRYVKGEISPRDAGRELNADMILCGSVRRFESNVRLTVQLIDVSADAALWAGKFDETAVDIFTVEDLIGKRVADALALELARGKRPLSSQRHMNNGAAYEHYVHGCFWLSRRTGASIHNAVRSFEEAARLDPGFALAQAGIAQAYIALSSASATLDAAQPTDVVPLARAAAVRALSLDDTLGDAHLALGHIALFYEWNWPAAEAAYQRAICLSPSSPAARQSYAFSLSTVGRIEEAMLESRLARELEPTSLSVRLSMGFILYRARRYGEAIEELTRCVALEPESVYARYRYGLALQQVGRYDEASSQFDAMLGMECGEILALVGKAHLLAVRGRRQAVRGLLKRLHTLSREHYVSAYFFAEIHAGLDDPDEALRWLDQACEERALPMVSLSMNPKFDGLQDYAAFRALLRRVGLWKSSQPTLKVRI